MSDIISRLILGGHDGILIDVLDPLCVWELANCAMVCKTWNSWLSARKAGDDNNWGSLLGSRRRLFKNWAKGRFTTRWVRARYGEVAKVKRNETSTRVK